MFPWNIFIFLLLLEHTVESKILNQNLNKKVVPDSDNELRRTKRTIFQALLKKRMKTKRYNLDEGIEVDHFYASTTARPFINKQVQEFITQLKAIHEWRNGMKNSSSPEFLLFSGNIIDDFANEFDADYNFISSKIDKIINTKSKNQILVNVIFRFYKSEDEPLMHLQGIVSKGWIGGQRVDPKYFKIISSPNTKPTIDYLEDGKLRVVPAMKSPENVSHHILHNMNYTSYKEIRISIKLKQKYQLFLHDRKTPEFSSLSGNVEEVVMKVFAHDELFIDANVLEFRESSEGRVIVSCAVKFKPEENYAIEKCQAMISSGDLEGMPVDDRFFIVDSLKDYRNRTSHVKEYGKNNTVPEQIPQPHPRKKIKAKPLRYKELRISLKFQEPWNSSFTVNTTKEFNELSGNIETGIDRALADNPYYIDATVVEFFESPEFKTISNIAIRFKLEEKDPEGKARSMTRGGFLSGLPLDERFFYVFSLSETIQPDNATSNLYNASLSGVNQTSIGGQKQPAVMNTPQQDFSKVEELKPIKVSTFQQQHKNLSVTTQTPPQNHSASVYYPTFTNKTVSIPPTIPVITTAVPSIIPEPITYNPYLLKSDDLHSKEQNKPITSDRGNATPTFNPYLPVNTNPGQGATNIAATGYKPISPITPGPTSTNIAEAQTNTIEGSMTLEQTWHPYLADKSSQVYKILEQSVVNAIRNVYVQSNEEVVPQVLGFSETNIPTTSITVKTEKKVGVRFKVLFMKDHEADQQPLVHAVSLKSVSGILIHENSLVVVVNPPTFRNVGSSRIRPLTLCQEQQREAETASEGMIGGFVPQCNIDGSYKVMQCHALTGYCWCVNENGVRLQDTEEKYKEPNCHGIKFKGNVILSQNSPELLPTNSCLTVSIQEFILCGGNISCHIPVTANETLKNLQLSNHSLKFEINTGRLKPGRYLISAVINVGWCRINSFKSKDLIHEGDYHSTTIHDIVIEADSKIIQKDIEVQEMLPEETGILMYGRVILPEDNTIKTIPDGSCLSIETKQLNVCTGPKCPILPISGNTTITGIELIENTIPYSMHLPEVEPGTYVISAVLHIGKCYTKDQTMIPGDYYNDQMHDYIIDQHTTEIEKNITMVKLKDGKAGGVFISGRVLLPDNSPPLAEGSCLTISSRKLIQCKNNNCIIPPVALKTFESITNEGGIPYTLLLPVATQGKYIISAVVNNGWCKEKGNLKDWIHGGDYYNNKVHDFEIKQDTLFVGKNIAVSKFEPEQPKTGVTIHGRVILPESSNETFSSKSCLTIKAQEFKLCGSGVNCINPLTAKETFHDFKLESHSIPYVIVMPDVVTGHFIISALMNIDWCKDDDTNSEEYIRNGDYHNEETHDFVISEGETDITKDIKLEEYNDVITFAPSSQPYKSVQLKSEPLITSTAYNNILASKEISSELSPTSKPLFKVMTQPSQPVAISIKSEITTPHFKSNTNQGNSAEDENNEGEQSNMLSSSNQDENKKLNLKISTEKPPAWYHSKPITIGVGQLYEITTDHSIRQLAESNNIDDGVTNSTETLDKDLIALPQGLPKSCQEIRDAGIGTLDGQYIIEARKGCHLSIICQDMENKDTIPKEFLGGPSEDEWKYWHYAVLIKLSYQDKLNMPSGACLEKSDAGKSLIKRVLIAGSKQDTPLAQWQTNISKLLNGRYKRDNDQTIITRAFTIYKNHRDKRSKSKNESDWGIL